MLRKNWLVFGIRDERERERERMRAIQRGREGGLGAGISDNKELHSWRAE